MSLASSLDALREQVLHANLEIVRSGLVIDTFGNASGIDRASGRVVIKPSGVAYDRLLPSDLVVTDLEGRIVEGKLRPSSDLPTHLALYRAFEAIGGVVHTHSRYATAWAQARTGIPCFGTTHADYFRGTIPVTEPMPGSEIQSEYEWNTGQAIVRRFASLDPAAMPAVLVSGHGPFAWGPSPHDAAHNAIMLEEAAHLAYLTLTIRAEADAIPEVLRDKHFLRKHGPGAYYGQRS